MKQKEFIFLIYCTIIGIFGSCTDEVSQLLSPEFSTNAQHIVVGEKISFKDESLGNPSKWSWYFEGGSPSTSILFSPTIEYNTPGTYAVQLTIGRGNDSVVINKEAYIVVDYPSEIKTDFSTDKTIATNEDLITFEDLSTGYPIEWLWEFTSKDGITVSSSEQNPSLTFEPGIYTVKFTAKNPNTSSTKVKTDFLTIIDKYSVAANFSSISRNTYAGGNIHFQDMSSGNATSWEWTFEGGTPSTSKEQNPKVSYSSPGKYKVTLKTSNDVNSSIIEKEKFVSVISGDNLVMYFPFDGSSLDAGPNQLNPLIVNKGVTQVLFDAASRYTGGDAEARSAAQFLSVDANNYAILSVPESDLLDFQASDFTVSFWAKIPPISKSSAVFHHGAGPGARPDNESRQSWFRFEPSGNFARFCVEQKGKAGNWVEYQGKSMTDNEWHHFVCIYKEVNGAKDGYMYIDGELVVNNLGKPIKTIDKTPYYIGCNYRITNGNFAPENFLKGYLDDYILYNRALSDQEVKELYTY